MSYVQSNIKMLAKWNNKTNSNQKQYR